MSSIRAKSARGRDQLAKKKTKHQLYGALFPQYQPLHPYKLYFLNRCSSVNDLVYLINLARRVIHYVVDTEGDYPSHCPSLIQIMFLCSIDTVSPIGSSHKCPR